MLPVLHERNPGDDIISPNLSSDLELRHGVEAKAKPSSTDSSWKVNSLLSKASADDQNLEHISADEQLVGENLVLIVHLPSSQLSFDMIIFGKVRLSDSIQP